MSKNGHKQSTPVLSIRHLRTHFQLDAGTVRAVDGVDLDVPRGKTLCIVGESGCGKSVTAFSVLRLISPPGRIVGGQVLFYDDAHGTPMDLAKMPENGRAMRHIRGGRIAMIFQEPMTSLSPVHRIGGQVAEAVRLHEQLSRQQSKQRAIDMMQRVGIPDAPRRYRQYPHELSGGLRQRAMIAMALTCRPALLIADEPTTALDVTIQAQILKLMRELQGELNMAIMLITHDLGVVAQVADEVAVMYMGRIVERAPTLQLFDDPQHPYTQALLDSIPGRSPHKSALKAIRGSIPDPFAQLPGCPFHPRCVEAQARRCDVGDRPPLLTVRSGHQTACLLRHPAASDANCQEAM